MLSSETIDTVIYIIIGIGLVWAVIRIYQDLTRPLPDVLEPYEDDALEDDTDQTTKHKKG